ncbi:hypothetical protein [Pseudoalteromonas luteoviolacea]|uniref:Uncharacterized protein n=1 Tax=Pseudoalteromonas luteoviolacea H33 TaxID=1365251 RepID=A0A167CY11_9GAMM|nr:hypothetical protein [Pseudoalteromonas luteoviolacea]KZN48196.1 hypothetical protein N476_22345 [Pseudoalteromonas luteoviolacea H33]KZN78210.1 hypothetical protein N477_10120 [Pseudoalteromonas luteoviolacea H33-S]MBQ4876638.1 hypothetical protein [Pseudoalteromonas luteoviolacea]MBQ4905573.1 hypothetical protein [Pseudoalteromonas luteoviolacea]
MAEQDKVKAAINSFYKGAGLDLTFKGEANPKVAEFFGEMVQKIKGCTEAPNWVPEPTGGKASISWIAKNFTQSVLAQFEQKQSLSCAKSVIWG